MWTPSDVNSRPRACVFGNATLPRRAMATPNSGGVRVDMHEHRSKTEAPERSE